MIIFLDCDGVINRKSDWSRSGVINTECVNVLVDLCHAVNANIVLSSTWRAGYAQDGNHSPQVKKLENILKKEKIKIVGITPITESKSRDEEISYYCRRNSVSEFIILDDDESLFKQKGNLYIVNPETGLTKNDYKKIAKRR